MINKTIQIGNSLLRKKAKIVPSSDIQTPKIKKLIIQLRNSMRKEELVGMAAPQLGVSMQIFVTEVRKTKNRKKIKGIDQLRVFINPKISFAGKQAVGYEGCGSIANSGIFGPVKRSDKVTIKALNEKGIPFVFEAKGFLARVIQHEYDHLQGILCIDKFSDTKKVMGKSEFIKT